MKAIAKIPLSNLPVRVDYQCVVEFCAKSPGYTGFTLREIQSMVLGLQMDPKARKAYRYTRGKGRKVVFGFSSKKDQEDFLWDMGNHLMDADYTCQRAFYTETDLTP
ncbi:hypothetical protein F5984_20620 [Rudanella paleaurantiibacter]|uniref:Uncharacterized protein n=1 Tax=Rudanella paleaurantiibacter TaxID=2614655 RepID=A0A7J5TVH6_9BACT|nr:hypothetical protein [Rudanella paleaurantiibacter]KAB7728152.1 hypothetical protein F5984_20620 [Rudanella paleaurantiibacter]